MIGVIDYGLGNVQAFLTLYKRLGVPAERATTPEDVARASHLILPGVGAFDHTIERFDRSGLRASTEAQVSRGVPVLGVCVGMQILAERSDEGTAVGLGWVPGSVRSFSTLDGADRLPHPHMGWNDIHPTSDNGLFSGLEGDARFYFLHSFYFEVAKPEHQSAQCNYGAGFSCAVSNGNVHGVQFHPEKSHHWGVKLLQNFSNLS